MGIFPVEFSTTTADRFESFRLLHYLAFIKGVGLPVRKNFPGCF